jgi:type VII secretion-associated serine protease mycosin
VCAAVTGLGLGTLAPVVAQAGVPTSSQWQLSVLRARSAWHLSTGSGVTVAVLDSGVDAAHPDLQGQVQPGADFVDRTTDGRRDFVGHGTTVAALIAGRNKATGVVGLAPKTKILPVRVLDKDNRYTDATTVANGLKWAVDHGAGVVNLSLGGVGRSGLLADAIDYAYQHDVVVVACTGNTTPGGPKTVWYPAREPGVIAVSGLTEEKSRPVLWSGALTGSTTVLTAPATDLLGARPGGYWRVQGTSFAAPLVTATAALIRARWPQMSAANVVNRLISTADDLGARGRDPVYGFGEVDPLRALTATVPSVVANPLTPSVAVPMGTPEATRGADGGGGPVPATPAYGHPVPVAANLPGADFSPLTWAVLAAVVAGAGLGGVIAIRRRQRRA